MSDDPSRRPRRARPPQDEVPSRRPRRARPPQDEVPSRRPREERGLLRMRSALVTEAERRGKRSLRTAPRARATRYDRRTGRVTADLTNGGPFAFPARDAQG